MAIGSPDYRVQAQRVRPPQLAAFFTADGTYPDLVLFRTENYYRPDDMSVEVEKTAPAPGAILEPSKVTVFDQWEP
jgi:hypothetical protein